VGALLHGTLEIEVDLLGRAQLLAERGARRISSPSPPELTGSTSSPRAIASARCSRRRIGITNWATVMTTMPPHAPNRTMKKTSSSLSGRTSASPRPR